MSIMSDEVNFLVYRYLQESGYLHSAFTFGLESHIAQSNLSGSLVPPGALVNILQKGVQYIEAELCIKDNGSLVDDLDSIEPVPLIDAVIPEALAARAATILRTVAHTSENAKTILASNDIETNGPLPNDTDVLLQGHDGEVFSCAWNPSSRILATGASDGTARLWTISEQMDPKSNIDPITLDHQILNSENHKAISKDVTALDWNHDGTLLASAAIDCQTRIWNSDGQPVVVLPAHKGLIFTLKWNKKGNYLLSASLDKKCIIWDTNNWEVKQVTETHQGPVVDVDWQNNSCFASCSTDKTVCVCKVGVDKPLKSFVGHTGEVNCVRWDPTGTVLASSADDKTVKIWSLKQDSPLHDLNGHTREVTLVEWCPLTTVSLLASACYDSVVRLWNVEQGTCLYTLNGHLEPVNSVCFSPDGRYLASGTLDGLMNIWSTQTGARVSTHRSNVGVFEVQWSPDGNKIALCQTDKLVKILDARKILASS